MDQQQFCIPVPGAATHDHPATAANEQQHTAAYCMFPPPPPPPSHTAEATIRHLGPVPPSPNTLAASNAFCLSHGIAPVQQPPLNQGAPLNQGPSLNSALWATPFTESPPMYSHPNSHPFGAQAAMMHHHPLFPHHHNPGMTRVVQFDPHALQIQSAAAEMQAPTDQPQLIQVHPSDFQLFNHHPPALNHGAPAWLSHSALPRVTSPAFSLQHIPSQQITPQSTPSNESLNQDLDLLRPVPMYRGYAPPGFGVSQRPLSAHANVAVYSNHNGAFMPPNPTPENYTINRDPSPGEQSTNNTQKNSAPLQRLSVSTSPGVDNQQNSVNNASEATPEDVDKTESALKSAKEMQLLNEFAVKFKKMRCELGYSPADVIRQIGIRYGVALEPDSVEEFESLRLELAAVKTMIPFMEMWVKDCLIAAGKSENEIITSPSTSIHPKKDRKRHINEYIRQQLEYEFYQKSKPSPKEIQAIAFRLLIDRDFICVWFCNRRHRQKKMMRKPEANHVDLGAISNHEMYDYSLLSVMPETTIPSPSHEVPLMLPEL